MIQQNRKRKRLLIMLTITLCFLGIAFIASASFTTGIRKYQSGSYFLVRQIFWYILGIILMFIMSRINYKVHKKLQGFYFMLGIIILVTVLVMGKEINGAKRWIPIFRFTIQPAEFAKLLFVLFYAAVLEKLKRAKKTNFEIIIPSVLVIWLYVGLIFLERDLSTSAHLFAVAAVMLFVSQVNIGSYGIFILMHLLLGSIGISMSANRRQRIMSYLIGLKNNVIGGGYQVKQSIIAIGNGGAFGTGYGNGLQKYYYLPERHTDFILAIIGEEIGFVGMVGLLSLYVFIMAIGLKTAIKTKDYFGKYLALGITSLIVIQILINVFVVTGMIPATGIPLPLISYGGSSLVTLLMAIGILINIISEGEEE
ncbi:MAG: putative lipid II flippase FtsW [Fusobacteriia bacterium 4572_132]|nr:MAG: putative lipid II flippase FtsW [Fusobacteriia bacterium 4572_132]